ncbi:MAG: hypothetical protein AAF230_04030 [Pseudomonadota bacterium]
MNEVLRLHINAPPDSFSKLRISNRQHAYIRNASRVAAKDGYREVCGIFFERNGYLRFLRKQNRTAQSGRYVLARKHLREAVVRASGIHGAFHSHSISGAHPSGGDIKAGPRQGYAVIYDVIGDEFRLWRIVRYKKSLLQCFDFDRNWLLDTSDDVT